jgi:hypothetical protein
MALSPAYRSLSDAVVAQTLADGEFPAEVRNAAEKVVVVLTQDWCPDWHAMDAFLPSFADKAVLFVLEYNKHPEFQKIMTFKEDVFGNREIPYLRYYHQGQLIVETNQLPRGTFEALLKKTQPFQLR